MDCSREKFSVLGLLIWYGISGVDCLDCYACVSKVWFLNMVKLSRSMNTKNSKYVSNSLQHDFFYSPWMVTRGVRTL